MADPLIIMVDSILQGNGQKKAKHLIANIWSTGGSDGKEPACNAGDLVRSLGGEDSLEEGMATHPGILAWRIPRKEEPIGLQSMGSQSVRHNWVMKHSTATSLIQLLISTCHKHH